MRKEKDNVQFGVGKMPIHELLEKCTYVWIKYPIYRETTLKFWMSNNCEQPNDTSEIDKN